MAWRIKFSKVAQKQFEKLPKNIQANINAYLLKLLDNPRAYGKTLKNYEIIASLKKYKKLWRYRIESYRIIVDIQDYILTILILKIDKRDKVYK